MTKLRKLGLVAAVAMLSTSVFAMHVAQDDELENATGQDGITIGVTLPTSGLSFSTIIHDGNGFGALATPGALIIGDPRGVGGIAKTSFASAGEILLNIDATGDVDTVTANNQAAVRINVTLSSALTIHTGDISVARSNGLGVALNSAPVDQTAKFLNDMTITIGSGSLMDITLGNEDLTAATGHMIVLNTNLTGGLSIANFSLNDAGGTVSGGSISATNIKMCDTSTANACSVTNNLAVKANADIAGGATGGLILTLAQVGLTTGMDIEMTGVKFGDASTSAIGNIDIVGLAFGNNAADKTVIRIAGH